MDAGYTATDYVLRQLVAQSAVISGHSNRSDECLYVTVTNGDNIYGSEVVERVLHAAEAEKNRKNRHGRLGADMILNPLDSRNFADQGTV